MLVVISNKFIAVAQFSSVTSATKADCEPAPENNKQKKQVYLKHPPVSFGDPHLQGIGICHTSLCPFTSLIYICDRPETLSLSFTVFLPDGQELLGGKLHI